MRKLKVAILGSGNIGTDLLIKVIRSPYLKCTAFISRNLLTAGMVKAQSLNINVSAEGISYIERNSNCCDIVFDATSAKSHIEHAKILSRLNKLVIDLTPAKVGTICFPVINIQDCLNKKNINMVTCGGQAAAPIVYAISMTHRFIEYIEVVSSIASRSAGPATRNNLDEYIYTTELALKKISGSKNVKAILNLNPAEPCINMQTTVFAKVSHPDIESLKRVVNDILKKVQQYVPGYEVIINPIIEYDRIVVMVRVKGLGDYLPAYAGNLDIINCAALAVAEAYAKNQLRIIQKDVHHEISYAE